MPAVDMMQDIRQLAFQTVAIEPYLSDDKYGEPSFSASADHSCRVVHRTREIRTSEQQVRLSTTQVYLLAATSVNPRSRVTLPDGTKPPIIQVETLNDEVANRCTVLYLGQ